MQTTSETTLEVGTPPTPEDADGSGVGSALPGDMLGRYRLVDRLGAGGMGVVYRARDTELERDVAIKVLHRVDERGLAMGAARLVREARAMASLSDPHVVAIYDVGVDAHTLFIAMELVEGTTLREWMDTTRDWRDVLALFEAAGRGIAAAHARGIVHRDFKPDNVLIASTGRVAVTDFGIAAALGDERPEPARSTRRSGSVTSSLTRTGVALGTPAYMSPEQHVGGDVDERSDQFSFCVALWEALYGRRPFRGRALERLQEGETEGLTPGRVARCEVPRRVEAVLRRGLRMHPKERWPSMEGVIDALASAREGRRFPRWAPAASLPVALGLGLLAARPAGSRCAELLSNAPVRPTRLDGARLRELPGGGSERWDLARERLERYVDAWTASADAVCRAEEPASVQGVRTRCLKEGAEQYRTVTGLIAEADEGVVAGLDAVLDSLAEPGACRTVASDVTEDRDPARVAAVSEVRSLLDAASAFDGAGRYSRAASLADAALARAQELDEPPLVARALYMTGRSLDWLGHYEEARDRLQQAAWYGLEHGEDLLALRAISELVFTLSSRNHEYALALEWADRAEPLLDRVGRRNEVASWLAHNRANVYMLQGRLEEARREHEAALLVDEALGNGDSAAVAAHRANYSNVLMQLGLFDLSSAQMEQALATFRRVRGSDHVEVGGALAMLGQCQVLAGNREAGRAALEEARDILDASEEGEANQLGTAEALLSVLARDEGRIDDARRHGRRALEIYRRAFGDRHPAIVSLLILLGNVERNAGDLDEAERLLVQARSVAVQTEATARGLEAVVGLGQVAEDRGDLFEAERLYDEAWTEMQAVPLQGAFQVRVASVLIRWGALQCRQGRTAEGEARLRRAVEVAGDQVQSEYRWQARLALARCIDPNAVDPEARTLAEEARRQAAAEQPVRPGALEEIDAYLESNATPRPSTRR